MASRKNFLLISMDDAGAYWRFRDVFRERLQTPNLDRLCAASTTFTAAYCQAPICGPSRNSVMTGLAPHQTGILDNYTSLFSVMRPEQLWQHRLKRGGYYCSTAGKVHHGFVPLSGSAHAALYSHPPKPLRLGPPKTVPVQRYGGLTGGAATTDPAHDALYYDHQSASDAVAFLESYDGAAPFYREVGFHHPHIPFRTPQRFKELYEEENFKQPEAWSRGFDTAEFPDRFMPENIDLRDLGHWRKSVRNYFSALSHVDSQIGRVWDALQASDHAKDTIVILFSDHGFHLGDKNRMRKYTLWEDCCRVPLVVHDPDAEPADVSDPVALLDIGPTVLDYAGFGPIQGAVGTSLVPQVHGASAPDRAVPTFLFGNASMRQGSYRITRYENGECEFHDVDDDPWLTQNLAHAHPFFDTMLSELVRVSAVHGLQLREGVATAGFGAMAPLDGYSDSASMATPGHRVHYATLDTDGVAALPEGFAKMQYGADGAAGVDTFVAVGNRDDNELVFRGSSNRFHLEVHPGPGENVVIAPNDDLVVYCGQGSTEVRAASAPTVVYGGTGHDVISTGLGAAWIDGGAGSADIRGGAGPADILTGGGTNTVRTGTGATHIEINGGSNTIELASDDTRLTIRRTGLPQRIIGYGSGEIDVSDWAPAEPVLLRQRGADAVLSCASETVVFCETDTEAVRPGVVGVSAV